MAMLAKSLLLLSAALAAYVSAQGINCPTRPPGFGLVQQPENIFSKDGVLDLTFDFSSSVNDDGISEFCYIDYLNKLSPTLRLDPGDKLRLSLKNDLPPDTSGVSKSIPENEVCGAHIIDKSSTNIHFHGTNVKPTCHKDEVVFTLVNSGDTFVYDIDFPADHAPGLYWYHPHIFGRSEEEVLGGASGAIIVEGMASLYPAIRDLPEQVLVLRDQNVRAEYANDTDAPAWDLTLNYVPVLYPEYTPAIFTLPAGKKHFFRLLNACAGSSLNVQLQFDGVPQQLEIVAKDGVPIAISRAPVYETVLILPPAARVEFIAYSPFASTREALLVSLVEDTGPEGDNVPTRAIARIIPTAHGPASVQARDVRADAAPAIAPLLERESAQDRKVIFSEEPVNAADPESDTVFFITVDGQVPKAFSIDNEPAVTAVQGTVEDWIIENQSDEEHVFHIHQIHFVVIERDGVPVAPADMEYLDTVRVPYSEGPGQYHSVKVRMNFSGNIAGDFVYHCHILEHEDKGMMARIRVVEALE